MQWFIEAVKKYAVFSGRARRKEYWMYFLVYLALGIVLSIVDALLGVNILVPLLWLGLFLPSLGVTVRRLHDTGRSGWWVLITIVPLVGTIVMLVFTCLDGDSEPNKYGPNPKSPVYA
ncbi:DUF805 domain-containing protein [Streptomyces sp. ZYX-F-203]|uniref:DUF805 domain-containing protein n=1 Tax=Streptomyces sp. HSG2 TaxID=2797167 RepID=UPI001903C733|nr:DUF805 domain-containing protein [Streptomyces sp. HSG2]